MFARQLSLSLAVLAVLAASCVMAQTTPQQPAQRQIVLTIMSTEVNNFAPGIDAAVNLSQEQANQVAAVYREVYQSSAVVLANLVLADNGSTMDQRRMATATLQQANQLFSTRARTVFTPEQQQLMDKVQAAFNKIFEKAQADLQARVKSDFGAQLNTILSAEQKAAMMKARQAIEDAQKKAQEQQKPPATTPATTPTTPAKP